MLEFGNNACRNDVESQRSLQGESFFPQFGIGSSFVDLCFSRNRDQLRTLLRMNGQYMSGVIDVETPPDGHNSLKGMLCRRRAERLPLPVEVMFTSHGLTVTAVIRDRSYDRDFPGGCMGIGILHNEALPLDVGLTCQTVTPTKLLPSRSVVTLIWTRHFGTEGFLSGGRMTWNEVRDPQLQECDSGTIPDSIEAPHGEV